MYQEITENDARKQTYVKTENWSWCVCQECGTWHKVWYPTTAGGLCPKCKEEMEKKFNFTFRNEITFT